MPQQPSPQQLATPPRRSPLKQNPPASTAALTRETETTTPATATSAGARADAIRTTIARPAPKAAYYAPRLPWDRLHLSAQGPPLRYYNDDDLTAPLPDNTADPRKLAAVIVVQAIEVLLGHRPHHQLQHWLSRDVYSTLVRRAGLAARIHGKAPRIRAPHVHRLQICVPAARVAEIALAIHDGMRMRAAALRLEYRKNRWRGVALEIA